MRLTDPREVDWTRPMVDHVHLRVADLAASRAFYDRVPTRSASRSCSTWST